MTKAELVARVHAKKNLPRELTKKTVLQIVDYVFTEMGDYFIGAKVTRGQVVKLTYPGFGTFTKKRKNGRAGRNPQTGAPIVIPPSITVTFQPGEGITKIALTVVGRVPGIDAAGFEEAAQGAKANCPVSKALAGVPEITLDASLS